ncbi:putative 2-hydroxyacid dehydrogenase [Fusobacterium sp. DD29]|uniref:C-terminal binding protein n=1 Tax=unclassified Fusobacterium TaxID=2648384 RepID=UPI001B8B695E|nr:MULTISPECIES: C-terminal binding protein [unclassified Fusobacterium]MBR8749504.1 putative 2-hydroxyacid dehydrogenase [Fusobacterium sp. DD29]MBR8761765.1 putative 2-hydroxyacid dehydrogenase [Fusobacterium sp. DD25]MBR8767783.1 putative 2-hydroxyacid dehydrogenase [Fusobacterium sp. DD43]MBR8771796.1 putative 2-hydroxyacid dehydrogenase [Fusobacterium sp. DD40]MBR8776059.1 putative 2-hydroxyacid dehydrogenase [Fusobacterium sp. DD17]
MKVIITDCDHANINIEKEILEKAGLTYELKQCKTEEDLIEQCKDGDIFINQYAPITRHVMESLPNLKLVVRYGVGVNNVDVKAATELGVQVCNVPDYGMNEVADQAIAMMMALVRKVVLMNEYTKTQKWDYIKSIPIRRNSTQIVGVVGLGRIGRNFAQKAHALGFIVKGYDPYYKKDENISFIDVVTLDEIIETSDIISIHCPLEGNKDLFNAETFKRMKKNAYLINVSRGGIINENDLDEALEKGEISGAALDCVEHEPMNPDSKLFRHSNLLVSPHMGWYSEEAASELKRKVAEESVRFANNENVHYPVNKLK